MFLEVVSKIPNISDKQFIGLTGNIILNLEDKLKIGDRLTGKIILDSGKSDAYGFALLTKENKTLLTETFNLKDIPKNKINSKHYFIKLEDFIDYQFEEKGSYELSFYVAYLEINLKKEFVVK